MRDDVLAVMIADVFVPFVPILGGFVFFMIATAIFLVMFSWLLPEEK